jgi:hypothetical protein
MDRKPSFIGSWSDDKISATLDRVAAVTLARRSISRNTSGAQALGEVPVPKAIMPLLQLTSTGGSSRSFAGCHVRSTKKGG